MVNLNKEGKALNMIILMEGLQLLSLKKINLIYDKATVDLRIKFQEIEAVCILYERIKK